MRKTDFLILVLLWFVASAARAGTSRSERELTKIKAAVMSADYRADLAELTSLQARAARLSGDPQLGYLADYWSGFAGWRIVLNGAGTKLGADEAKAHLARA